MAETLVGKPLITNIIYAEKMQRMIEKYQLAKVDNLFNPRRILYDVIYHIQKNL